MMPRFEGPRYPSKLFKYNIKEALWWKEEERVSFDNYGAAGGAFNSKLGRYGHHIIFYKESRPVE